MFQNLETSFRRQVARYLLVVRAFGENFDISSVPQQVSEEWVMMGPPTDVSCNYNSAHQNDTLTVSCSTVPRVSSYTLAVMNMQQKHLVISATVQGLSTEFKGEDIKEIVGTSFSVLHNHWGILVLSIVSGPYHPQYLNAWHHLFQSK